MAKTKNGPGERQGAALAPKDQDPDFAEAWADAGEEATDLPEHTARRRAAGGREEPVYFHGQEIGRARRFSEELMLLFLRAGRGGEVALALEVPHVFHGDKGPDRLGRFTIKPCLPIILEDPDGERE